MVYLHDRFPSVVQVFCVAFLNAPPPPIYVMVLFTLNGNWTWKLQGALNILNAALLQYAATVYEVFL